MSSSIASSSSSSPKKILISKVKVVVSKSTLLENGLTVSLGRGANIVVLDKLLLLANHVLQLDDGSSLQLQVKEQLHVLALQEVVLDDEFEEVFVVLQFYAVGAD